jgi:hypothetical protein
MIDQQRGKRKMPARSKDSLSFPPHCGVAMVAALRPCLLLSCEEAIEDWLWLKQAALQNAALPFGCS